MTQLVYAGIGSRATPGAVLENMTVIATWLARRGWHLNTGGAIGADTAFAAGAPGWRTLFLPWPGYRGHAGPDCHSLSPDRINRCIAIAASLHPAWHRCSLAARKLHARNVQIVLGTNAASPTNAVVCWTRGGAVTGGTGLGIRIARAHGIPVLNMGVLHPRAVCERLEDIRMAALPTVPAVVPVRGGGAPVRGRPGEGRA